LRSDFRSSLRIGLRSQLRSGLRIRYSPTLRSANSYCCLASFLIRGARTTLGLHGLDRGRGDLGNARIDLDAALFGMRPDQLACPVSGALGVAVGEILDDEQRGLPVTEAESASQPVSARLPGDSSSPVTTKITTLSWARCSASTAAHSGVQLGTTGLKYAIPSASNCAITGSRHVLLPQVPNNPTTFFSVADICALLVLPGNCLG